MPRGPRTGSRYRTACAKLRAQRLPCWICGRPIDYEAKPRTSHSFSADHVDPIARGGHVLGELRAAHYGCNSRRGDGTKRKTQAQPLAPITRRSRAW